MAFDRGTAEHQELQDVVVKINRCATVVKGGRRFSFSALVVVGDRAGRVGIGFGKANEVPPAVEKAIKDAQKNLIRVPLHGETLPHEVWGAFGASRVFMKPAAPGTGVIAGAAVRAIMELAGVRNVLTKAYGSTNPLNLVKATFDAVKNLRTVEDTERLRGVKVS